MKLSDRQFLFLQDVSRLIDYCVSHDLKITAGELYRTAYQHERNVQLELSKATRSKHQERLAIDLNFFFQDKSMYACSDEELRKRLEHVGAFWEGLREGNRWGGRWTRPFDPAHFEAK